MKRLCGAILRRCLLALLVITLFAIPAFAGTYYVSPDGAADWANCGPPAKSGTAACSWQTAMANVVAGDTVYFRGGIYEPGAAKPYGEPVMHPPYGRSGTADNPIIFTNYPGETPIIHEPLGTGVAPQNNTGPAIGCYQNDYVNWDGFTIVRDKDNGYQASSVVKFELSNYCAITNSDIIGRPQLDQYNGALISIVQSRYIYIHNNKLHGKSCGLPSYSGCVNATAIWSFDFDHVYIHNNDVYDNNNCISTKIGTSNLYIYSNHLWNCPRSGINYGPQNDGTTDTYIYQNVIRNSGPALYAPDPVGLYYNLIFYNNTIYNSGANTLAIIGNGVYTNARDPEIFNNIISVGASSNFVRYGDGEDKPAYANYNDFFGSGTWSVAYSAAYDNISDWRSAMNLDMDSITSDPLFVNAGGENPEDYKLQATSPAKIGRGGSYASVMGAYITGNEDIGYCPNPLVRINDETTGYSFIRSTYVNVAADNDIMRLQGRTFRENLILDKNINITLAGGYNCEFSSNAGYATLSGQVTISDGTVTMDRVIIK